MKVDEAVANAFVKEGTSVVFGLLGSGQMGWWAAMAKHPGVQMIDARDEGSGLAMADGWARASGRIGVCSVTEGPGLVRCAVSLVAAARCRTPIVVYTSRTHFNDERATQFLNTDRFANGVEAGYIEVLTPDFAEEGVRQAFYRAKIESRPVVLCFPRNIQNKECDSEGDEYRTSTALIGGVQRLPPDPDRLEMAAKIIAASKKPVVLIGRGARDPQARQAAERLAARIGALTTTSILAKGMLGDGDFHVGVSGLFTTRTAMKLFEEADCLIAAGASLNANTLAGGFLYPNARVIHIDRAPHVVMGNEHAADCYVQGDATLTLQALDELLAKRGVAMEGFRTGGVRKSLVGAERDSAEFEIEPGTVDPREAIRVLDERLPTEVGVVTGTAHNFSITAWVMRKPRPLQIYVNHFTGVGQVLGNAIGVAVAAKGPVVAVDGDGSAMQNIQELDTAARLSLKLLYFVMNDEAYGAEYHRYQSMGLDGSLSLVRSPDLGAAGRAFGCRGRLCKSMEDVSAGVEEFMAGDGPMVLDVRTSRNVISIPYRRAHYGQDV